MRFLRIVGVACALAIASSQVMAFQEEQAGSAAPAKSPAPGIVIDNSGAPAGTDSGIQFGDVPPAARDKGTEVFIPGLGSLGILPRLDFGLELLYGATETPAQAPDSNDLQLPGDNDDLMIKGRVKHRF